MGWWLPLLGYVGYTVLTGIAVWGFFLRDWLYVHYLSALHYLSAHIGNHADKN